MDRVRQWVLMSAVGVVAMCAWLLLHGEGMSPARLVDVLVRGGVGVAAAAAVLVGSAATVRLATRGRRGRRVQLLEQLHERTAREVVEGHTVTASRWSSGLPGRIVVTFPGGTSVSSGMRGRLAREVGQLLADRGGPRRWTASTSRLRPRVVLTPVEITAQDAAREAVVDRTVALLKKTVPGARSVRITAWTETGEPDTIVTTFEPSPRLSSSAMGAAILRVVTDNFPGRWAVEWDREHDQVTFHRKPGLPDLVDRPASLPAPGELMLRYGVDANGQVHSWHLGGVRPHGLVVGPTGGGKTFALRAMAMDAIAQGVKVIGADPKMIELNGFEGLPGVGTIATTPQDIADLIEEVYALMWSRYEDLQALRVRKEDLEPILFIVDEVYIIKMRLNRMWKADGGKGEHPAWGNVQEILALARSARIHLCLGIQRPDAEFLEGAARDNIRHRVSLSELSPVGAQMMWNDQVTGTDLPAIQGRAVATGPDGPVEIQVYRVPDPDLRLRGERTPEELAVLESVFGPAPPASPILAAVPDLVHVTDAPAPATDEEKPPGEAAVRWANAPADSLVVGDVVRLDGQEVALTEVDIDEDDEDYIVLTWATGALAIYSTDDVERAA